MTDKKLDDASALRRAILIYLDELLQEFEQLLREEFQLPSSLWAFDKQKILRRIDREGEVDFYPALCKILHETHNGACAIECASADQGILSAFLRRFASKAKADGWDVCKCHLGLSRIVFPIIHHNEVLGALVVGKFRKLHDDIDIRDKISHFAGNNSCLTEVDDPLLSKDMLDRVDTIPLMSLDEITAIAKRIHNYVPFIKNQFIRFNPSLSPNSLFEGILFLESFQESAPNFFLPPEHLWSKVSEMLYSLVKHLHLRNGIARFSDSEDYSILRIVSSSQAEYDPKDTLIMQSSSELDWLTENARGVVFPTRHKEILWMNDYRDKIFGANEAIAYVSRIFSNKYVLISFGFEDNVFLSNVDRFILRIAAGRIMKYIRNYVIASELDEMMNETGHKLRRNYDTIKGATKYIDYIVSGGVEGQDAVSLLNLSGDALRSGLSQLDLITRNYRSFFQVAAFQTKTKTHSIDVKKVIEGISQMYVVDLERDEIAVRYDGFASGYSLSSNKEIFQLLLWNIFDNAVKFSYNNTEIKVSLREIGGGKSLNFQNRGIGCADDEKEKVFQRYARSRYRDPNRTIPGQGIGLAICKRCVNVLFPEGAILLSSRPAHMKGDRRFQGDNYLTDVTIHIPTMYWR